MVGSEYVLDDDEYEVVETGYPRPIESEAVKRKLESSLDEVIEQDDFEDFYSVSDYFSPGQETFPRDISGNKGQIAGAAAWLGVYSTGAYALTKDPHVAMGGLLAIPIGVYLEGLIDEDMELGKALSNSRRGLSERIDF